MIMNISKVAPTERRWSGSDHRITLAKAKPPFATDPVTMPRAECRPAPCPPAAPPPSFQFGKIGEWAFVYLRPPEALEQLLAR